MLTPRLMFFVAKDKLKGVLPGWQFDYRLSLTIHVMKMVVVKGDQIVHRRGFIDVNQKVVMPSAMHIDPDWGDLDIAGAEDDVNGAVYHGTVL